MVVAIFVTVSMSVNFGCLHKDCASNSWLQTFCFTFRTQIWTRLLKTHYKLSLGGSIAQSVVQLTISMTQQVRSCQRSEFFSVSLILVRYVKHVYVLNHVFLHLSIHPVYLNVMGINPKEHGVKQELVRCNLMHVSLFPKPDVKYILKLLSVP